MNLFLRFPLAISFLLITLLTSISISAYTYLSVFSNQIIDTTNAELARINQRMIELQGTINDFNRRKDPNAIHREVSRLSNDRTMELITIIDEHGVIKFSSSLEYRNTPVRNLPNIDKLINNNQTLQPSGSIALSKDKTTINALYPLDTISHLDHMSPDNKSFLFARFNLSQVIHKLRYRQQLEIIQTSVIHFSMLSLGFLLLYIAMTGRIKTINHAINEFSRGHYSSRIELIGNNEFDQISHGFNNMAAQVSTQSYLLREQEHDLSVTLNSIGDAVIATDADGRITRMNPVAQKLTGWSIYNAMGTSIDNVFKIKDAKTNLPLESPIKTVLETAQTITLDSQTILLSKDGIQYHISNSASPIIDHENHIQGMVLIFNDVSEEYKLKQIAEKSERLLNSIMENTPAVIHVKDTQGKFTFINKEFETVFKLTKNEVLGKTLFDIFPKSIADEMYANDQKVLNTSSILEIEESAIQDDGPHIYNTIKFPLTNEQGDVDSVCGISTDITIRKNQEQQLYRSQKMESLGKLTGGIAHDYNNMLGIVLGYCELIKLKTDGDEKLKEYTDQIQYACERGSQLSKKLLSFSSKKQSNPSVVNISHLIQERSDMLQKTLTASISLEFYLQEDIWPVELTAGDLEDAIINICINSKHAMPDGGLISIRTNNQTLDETQARLLSLPSGNYVVLSISDNGYGMDQDTQDKMFEPFFTSKGINGTGLGLSQVYGFAQSSHGAINVISAPGEGTELSLYFPMSDKKIDIKESKQKDTPNQISGKETILVVDDERALREYIKQLLESYQYNVFTADGSEQALDILSKQHIDLIYSDVIMPGMNGYQLAKKVQTLYPNIKIQLVSGYTDNHHSAMSDTNLHKNLLTKPVKAADLLQRLRDLLQEKQT